MPIIIVIIIIIIITLVEGQGALLFTNERTYSTLTGPDARDEIGDLHAPRKLLAVPRALLQSLA